MFRLGYLDDDKGIRTTFARQFENDFEIVMFQDIPQFGIRIVHKKVGSLTNILYLYR